MGKILPKIREISSKKDRKFSYEEGNLAQKMGKNGFQPKTQGAESRGGGEGKVRVMRSSWRGKNITHRLIPLPS